jgi:hypothetical protein
MQSIPAIFCFLAGFLLYILACLQPDTQSACIVCVMSVFVMFIAVMMYLDEEGR